MKSILEVVDNRCGMSTLPDAYSYFFLKKPASVLWPLAAGALGLAAGFAFRPAPAPAPAAPPPKGVLDPLFLLSAGSSFDTELWREAVLVTLGLLAVLVLETSASGSDSPEYDSSV
jgi:hypothetical protein